MDGGVASARLTLAQMSSPSSDRTFDGGGGLTSDDFPGTYDALVAQPPADDLAAQLRDPESAIERNVNSFLRRYEQEQHASADPRSLPIAQQPLGALASNSVSALLDVVQEVSSAPSLTLGGVLAAVTRSDRAAYLGIVCVFVGVALVLLDVDA